MQAVDKQIKKVEKHLLKFFKKKTHEKYAWQRQADCEVVLCLHVKHKTVNGQ